MMIKRIIKFWWQRITCGWDDSETWSLDISIAKHITPRLKRFKELNDGYPMGMNPEAWNRILDMMIEAFELVSDGDMEWRTNERSQRKIRAGLYLFHKYYFQLWW